MLLAAGLLAKKAVEAGLKVPKHINILAGARIARGHGIPDQDRPAALSREAGLRRGGLRLHHLHRQRGRPDRRPERSHPGQRPGVLGRAVGNRNFEARIHPNIKANFLASPPLVVAYALAGTVTRDLMTEPVGRGKNGDVWLGDIWPSSEEIQALLKFAMNRPPSRKTTARSRATRQAGGEHQGRDGRDLQLARIDHIAEPPFFEGFGMTPAAMPAVRRARAGHLRRLGDHRPHLAGRLHQETSPAGKWLKENGVMKADFNSYGSRRGNHEIMMRGTFANVRIKNLMIPARPDGSRFEGGETLFQPTGEQMSIYDAAMKYVAQGTSSVVFGGEEYGTGSSRDWAAKGTQLLGVKAVIARSFERIHRSKPGGHGRAAAAVQGRRQRAVAGHRGQRDVRTSRAWRAA